jgi:deoxyribodipyrimidine photo-lyase
MSSPAPLAGGRTAALARLDAIDPGRYGKTRNHLDGAVTRLSADLRHGALSLAEVKHAALAKVHKPYLAEKLVFELGWRDYFRRVWGVLGEGVWEDVEPNKAGLPPEEYAEELPPEIEAGETGVDWVDHFADELRQTGYLHNHARMWLACYVVHARRVRWQAGAEWFLRHLLDGDEASNNLSWQWVVGTFSSKPYLANRGNVIKHTGDRFPEHARNDPMDASYDVLREQFFPQPSRVEPFDPPRLKTEADEPWTPPTPPVGKCGALLPDDALRPTTAAARAAKDSNGPLVFCWFGDHHARFGDKRRKFVKQCLADIGDVIEVDTPAAAAEALGDVEHVVTTPTPDPPFDRLCRELGRRVTPLAEEPFTTLPKPADLKRFSRYWNVAKKGV